MLFPFENGDTMYIWFDAFDEEIYGYTTEGSMFPMRTKDAKEEALAMAEKYELLAKYLRKVAALCISHDAKDVSMAWDRILAYRDMKRKYADFLTNVANGKKVGMTREEYKEFEQDFINKKYWVQSWDWKAYELFDGVTEEFTYPNIPIWYASKELRKTRLWIDYVQNKWREYSKLTADDPGKYLPLVNSVKFFGHGEFVNFCEEHGLISTPGDDCGILTDSKAEKVVAKWEFEDPKFTSAFWLITFRVKEVRWNT